MNVSVGITVAAATLNLATAVMSLALSRAQTRRLALLYSVLALTAAAYNCLGGVIMQEGYSDEVYRNWSMLAHPIAAIHVAAWVVFAYADAGGSLASVSRSLMGGLAAMVLLSVIMVVGGWGITPQISVIETGWAGIRYHFPIPTPLGDAFNLLLGGLLILTLVRLVSRYRKGERDLFWVLLGFAVFVVCAVEELLVANRVITFLFLADAGFMAVIISLPVRGILQLNRDAQRLTLLSAHLESEVQRRIEEHASVRATLLDTERSLGELLASIDAVLWEGDAVTFQLLFVSDSITSLLGTPPEVWTRNPRMWATRMHPEDLDRLMSLARSAIETGQSASGEYRVFAEDGTIRWFRNYVTPVPDATGKIVRIRGIMIHTTASHQIQEALTESEERYRSLFENASIGLYRSTPDGRVLMVNPSLLNMLGFTSFEELSRRRLDDVEFDPLRRRTEFKHLCEEQGGVTAFESAWTRRDGSIMYVRENARAIRNSLGVVISYEGSVEDITATRLAQQHLHESEEQFRQLVEGATEAIFISKNWCFDYLNPKALNLFGATDPAQLLGTPVLYRVDLGYHAVVRERHQQIWRGAPLPPVEEVYRRLDGSTFAVEVTTMPFSKPGSDAAVVFFHDITARKRAQRERIHLETQLLESQKLASAGQLAGGLAHEFKNLLTVINGYSDLVRRRVGPSDPIYELIAEIRKAGGQAADLTQHLLALSNRQAIAPKPVLVGAFLEGARGMLEKLLGENIELRTSFEAPLGCVLADEGQLTQVLVKLAANARDAMPDGGAMAIRTANCTVSDLDRGGPGDPPPGEYVRISITETSKGIDEATQQPGFDDGSTTAEPDRGLSSVYGIVRRLGGWIAVDGKDGEETTFMIILPRIDSGSAGGLVPESLRGSETVLLGLAEQDQRERVNGVLREAGYQVLAGSDGAEVLALAETHTGPIHLLLTELDLPRLSGCDLAQRVQARHRLAKVVYTTGATKDGVDETQNLLEKVRETLGPRRTIPRILVVDDDPAVARVFRRILTGGGYEVDVVHGGDAALRYLSANSVDLVLTDLVMPDGEGLAMIRAIRQRQPDLKIIAASGAFEGQFLKAANAFGADASLRKPIDPKDLLEKTRELLSAG